MSRGADTTRRTRLGWTLSLAACVVAAAGAALAESPPAPPPAAALDGSSPVPLKYLPPGTEASPYPSEPIFGAQVIPLRFDHQLHLGLEEKPKLRCDSCHPARASDAASDRLLPDPAVACDRCHGSDHRDLERVRPGAEPDGQCSFCHLGANAGRNGRVARVVLPRPNLKSSHRKHLRRNIGCAQCHGDVSRVGLATREQLPRMPGCFVCHAMSGPARGEARGACTTCHLTRPGGQLDTDLPAGPLEPPHWMHGAEHGPDWLARHRPVAAANSTLCANCHAEPFCTGCHDGRLRPRAVHPGDWISMHPQAGRQDNPRCTSCHQLESFCGSCHRRVGVARDAPSRLRQGSRRFHLPSTEWSSPPRGPRHHAWEAMRNLNACVACHSERDCASCHATRGLRGGQGVNPHPPGFTSRCGPARRANPRPCYVCHRPSDPLWSLCP
ncbi:MAG: cytochrome c3 family protein [Deltaproteobacteria bacterium]|jgi:hypothetical protein|nr:cytochrome c3 family protein [Deltaproteobacteria bacterium]MBW2537760.1 cytochrome c3 family protein [Deltaproteobacteria bacterium]